MDSDARDPQAPEPEIEAAPGAVPPAEDADEVLQDEIESIRAIGEDQ